MKQITNSFRLISRLSDSFIPVIISAIVLPFLLLCILGIWFIITSGYTLYFVGFLAFLALIVLIIYALAKKYRKNQSLLLPGDEITVERSPQWSTFDNEVWEKLKVLIDEKMKNDIEWRDMQAYSLEIVSETASYYHPDNSEKELAFSASEMLLAIEEVSRRYRGYVKKYVPFEEKIKLSFFKQGFKHREKIGWGYNAYRMLRMVNPASAIVSEIRGKMIDTMFENVSGTVQYKMKKALLEEVASVAIDLYRGHFKIKDEELPESEQTAHEALHIEPLKVTIVGQVGSGKSSLVNALKKGVVASTDVLPDTDKAEVHRFELDQIDLIELIDLPGLDGSLETEGLILEQTVGSDIVLWVLKANQSARKLDLQMKQKFDDFYQDPKNRSRKQPSILFLLNQVDRLQPVSEWDPPYDISVCDENDKKCCNIRDAIAYNKEVLGADQMIALSISPDRAHHNLESVTAHLAENYETGIDIQLNRRRQTDSGNGLAESGKRMFESGKAILGALRK